MDQISKLETKPLGRSNFSFAMLGSFSITSLSSSKKHSIMLFAYTLMHLHFAKVTQVFIQFKV